MRPLLPNSSKTLALWVSVLAVMPAQAQNPGVDALFDLLCGRTTHFYDETGNQIEYTAADGTAYLWYHGEAEVILGTWNVSETEAGAPQVCYQYKPGSFGFEALFSPTYCFSETQFFENVVQGGVFNGDRYGLHDGTPPYTMAQHPFVEIESLTAEFPEQPAEPACGIPIS